MKLKKWAQRIEWVFDLWNYKTTNCKIEVSCVQIEHNYFELMPLFCFCLCSCRRTVCSLCAAIAFCKRSHSTGEKCFECAKSRTGSWELDLNDWHTHTHTQVLALVMKRFYTRGVFALWCLFEGLKLPNWWCSGCATTKTRTCRGWLWPSSLSWLPRYIICLCVFF